MRTLERVDKVFNAVFRRMGQLSIFIIIGLMLVVCADVFLRKAFNKPIYGSTEIVQMVTLCLFLVATIWATLSLEHIKVDLLDRYIPKRVQRILNSIFYTLCLGLYVLIGWQYFSSISAANARNAASVVLHIPKVPFYAAIGVVSFCVVVILLEAIIKNIVLGAKNEH